MAALEQQHTPYSENDSSEFEDSGVANRLHGKNTFC